MIRVRGGGERPPPWTPCKTGSAGPVAGPSVTQCARIKVRRRRRGDRARAGLAYLCDHVADVIYRSTVRSSATLRARTRHGGHAFDLHRVSTQKRTVFTPIVHACFEPTTNCLQRLSRDSSCRPRCNYQFFRCRRHVCNGLPSSIVRNERRPRQLWIPKEPTFDTQARKRAG